MKIGTNVYFICDHCKKYIERGDMYYLIQCRKAGQHAPSNEEREWAMHVCGSCMKQFIPDVVEG